MFSFRSFQLVFQVFELFYDCALFFFAFLAKWFRVVCDWFGLGLLKCFWLFPTMSLLFLIVLGSFDVPSCFLFFSVECLSRAVFCSLTLRSVVLHCFRSFSVAWRCSMCFVVVGCFRIVLSFLIFSVLL